VIALSRKNALFAGSDEGAENWAMLASLIESCKLHGINPEAYLTDVLTKLVNNWPNSRLAELTPWGWSTAHLIGGANKTCPVEPLRSWPRLIAYAQRT
jgi:transposase